MKGTPRAPWTPAQDKKLRALVLSANSVDTIAEALISSLADDSGSRAGGVWIRRVCI